MPFETIESDIQGVILNALPDDYDLAMRVMCQLIANMMLSNDMASWSIDRTTKEIEINLLAYEGT